VFLIVDINESLQSPHPSLRHRMFLCTAVGTSLATAQGNPSTWKLGVLLMKPRILIVDDDEAITQQLFWTLSED
jgi:hypothetical protein